MKIRIEKKESDASLSRWHFDASRHIISIIFSKPAVWGNESSTLLELIGFKHHRDEEKKKSSVCLTSTIWYRLSLTVDKFIFNAIHSRGNFFQHKNTSVRRFSTSISLKRKWMKKHQIILDWMSAREREENVFDLLKIQHFWSAASDIFERSARWENDFRWFSMKWVLICFASDWCVREA